MPAGAVPQAAVVHSVVTGQAARHRRTVRAGPQAAAPCRAEVRRKRQVAAALAAAVQGVEVAAVVAGVEVVVAVVARGSG